MDMPGGGLKLRSPEKLMLVVVLACIPGLGYSDTEAIGSIVVVAEFRL